MSATNGARAPRRAARRVSFTGHEIAEYVIALALIASGLHLAGRLEYELVATGAAMAVLGLVSAGPLGAIALCSRRLHHLVDLLIAAGLALSPFVFSHDRGVAAIVVAELIAGGLVWIARATRYIDLARPARRGSLIGVNGLTGAGPVADRAAALLSPAAGRAARHGARRLGLLAGVTRRVARAHKAERAAKRTP